MDTLKIADNVLGYFFFTDGDGDGQGERYEVKEITSHEQMVQARGDAYWSLGQDNKHSEFYWNEYMSKPGAKLYVVTREGKKYAVYGVNGEVEVSVDDKDNPNQGVARVLVDEGYFDKLAPGLPLGKDERAVGT